VRDATVKTPLLFVLYRQASRAAGAAYFLYFSYRTMFGRSDVSRRREQRGEPSIERPEGPFVLLYTVNMARAGLLRPLIDKLADLGINVLLATKTEKGGALPNSCCLHQLAPLDVPRFVVAFFDYWQPDLVLIDGMKFPANLIWESNQRAIPLALVSAHLPARSFLRGRKFSFFMNPLLQRIDLCLTNARSDADRLKILGARNAHATGDLIYDLTPPPIDQSMLASLLARIGTRPIWVVDGAHPSEDEIILAVHRKLKHNFPGLLTVLIPEDQKRGFEIARLAQSLKLTVRLRGSDRDGEPLPEVYIARKRADAGLFYRAAGIIFAGTSLSAGGGENPLESACLGCAVLHGPQVGEFSEFYRALDQAGGGALVFDAETLAKELALLLYDNAELRAMSRAAARVASEFQGASAKIILLLKPYLAQAMVAPRIGRGEVGRPFGHSVAEDPFREPRSP